MQIGYILKEGFSGFKRAKLSMFAAIFTICVSLLLLSFFAILFLNANNVVNSLRDKMELEAFLVDYISKDKILDVISNIKNIEGVREIKYISKDEAAKIFKEDTGEDIYNILNFNPLPQSLKIFLKDGYKNSKMVGTIALQVKQISGIESVAYRKDLLDMLDQHAMLFIWLTLGIGIFIAISSIILVANTIRLAIYAKRKIIQTMKLIGATRSFIRMPFLLEGFLQGLIGGLFASGIIYFLFNYLQQMFDFSFEKLAYVPPAYYVVIIAVGVVLGLLGSMISIRKFISESVGS